MNDCFECFVFRVHVVFGQVISGQDVVTAIENQKADEKSRPITDVRISNCGELVLQAKPKGNSQLIILILIYFKDQRFYTL